NLISGNLSNGVSINDSYGVEVQNNYIGTDAFGLFSNTSLSNSTNGVLVDQSFHQLTDPSVGVTIGGAANNDGNVISGNLKAGIRLLGGGAGDLFTGSNLVQGNKIGTTASGNSDIGNGADGIDVINSAGNILGGSSAGAGNIITGNNGNGILISGVYPTLGTGN